MSKRPLLIIFLTVFIDLLGFGIVLPMLPLYALELIPENTVLHLPVYPYQTPLQGLTIGLLLASFSAMQFLFTPIWGRVSDRVGRRPIILLGLAGSVVFYALFGYGSAVGSLTLLFVSRIGAGIAGATIATAQAYIADSTPPEKRTSGLALIGMAFGIGFVFGPLIGFAALEIPVSDAAVLSPYPGYVAAGLSAAALALAIFELPESLKPGVRPQSKQWLNLNQFRQAMAMPTIIPLILIGFVAVFAFAEFESTLSRFAADVFQLDKQQIFKLFAYTGVSLMIAQGFIVRRLNRVISDEKMAASGALILLVSMIGLSADIAVVSMPLLLLVLPILVTGFALLTTSVQSLISRRTPADEQGGVLGANQAGSSMARILGPALANILYGYWIILPFLVATGLLVIVQILLLMLPRVDDQSNRSSEVEPVAADSEG